MGTVKLLAIAIGANNLAAAAVVFSVAGLHLGRASRRALEQVATVASGLVLVAIGVAVALGVF